jgi:hypothetical protein
LSAIGTRRSRKLLPPTIQSHHICTGRPLNLFISLLLHPLNVLDSLNYPPADAYIYPASTADVLHASPPPPNSPSHLHLPAHRSDRMSASSASSYEFQNDFGDPECCHCASMSVRSASPAPSLYSFSSSRDGHMLKELHGRALNTLCEASLVPLLVFSSHLISLSILAQTYMLPADEQEFLYASLYLTIILKSLNPPSFSRHHDRVHQMWRLHFDGGLCINQIALGNVLDSPNFPDGRRKSVLDLGFGSGLW